MSLRVALAVLFSVVTFNWAEGQSVTTKVLGAEIGRTTSKQPADYEVSAEKLVRDAYEKLTVLSKAALLLPASDSGKFDNEERFLKFQLSNFKVGPIEEILTALHHEIKTGGSADVIELTRTISRINDDDHVSYRAEWAVGQYASIYDRNWTIGDLLGYDPAVYHDVGEYALYDVKVTFQRKSRVYRALALFHNPYRSIENLKPSFWDSVVGAGGALTEVWNEERPPFGQKVSPTIENGGGSGLPTVALEPSMVRSVDYTHTTTEETPIESSIEDRTEHISGAHGELVRFLGSCSATSTTQQLCRVDFNFRYTYENGTTSNLIYVHRNKVDEILGTQTGPRGTPISCYSGRGIATENCLSSDCDFNATLVGSGFSMQMTGGSVWRGQLIHGHTCNLPRPGRGVCLESSILPTKSPAKAPSPTLINPSCCDPAERQGCISGGGEWYESSCTCFSPIVIDVAGDGFNLTNAADGVLFDLARSGEPERFSWTAAGSDDAWLVLDRNGNGIIDDGKELFGSSTPQPYLAPGESKNGFRALAMFDTSEYGGHEDGQIDRRDSVFASLKLWTDRNHNGFSEPEELLSLSESDVRIIEVGYRESRRRDENGNWFRYRAKVKDAHGAQVGRWAWDVFLQRPH